MRSAVPIAVLVLALAGTAAAQPGVTPPISAPPQPGMAPPGPLPPPPLAQPQGVELSETTALLLSLGGTAASWTLVGVAVAMDNQGNSRTAANLAALGLVGTFFAPSFGHWYARSFLSRGLGLRAAGVSTELLAFMVLVVEGVTGQDNSRLAEGVAIAGAALYVAGTVDDIVTAPGSARRYNQRFQNLAVVPMIRPDAGGVMLTGRF